VVHENPGKRQGNRIVRALVTGGAGFIGGHVVNLLCEQGHEVTVLDNLSTGHRRNLSEEIKLVQGDVRDGKLVGEVMAGQDVLFHLGAFVSLPESFEKPDECHSVNVEGTRCLLEAAVAAGIGKVVFSSTSALYPEMPAEPKREDGPLEPLSPYATSKREGEKLLEEFSSNEGLSYVALRYFNVFGPRQRADSAYAAVIPIFISRALAGQSLTLYGDGHQTRDFIFVRDVARANLRASQVQQAGIYNVGSGHPMRIVELADQVCAILGRPRQHEFAPRRPGDLLSSTASIERTQQDLEWQPEYTFKQGLEQTLEWWESAEREA
jgi:UDP-glucose 4-epimerase